MVNLLTFKSTADAPDEGMAGEEAYRRYAAEMRAFVESKGGRFLWIGRVDSQVIGTGGEGFARLNIGTSGALLEEAVRRMAATVELAAA